MLGIDPYQEKCRQLSLAKALVEVRPYTQARDFANRIGLNVKTLTRKIISLESILNAAFKPKSLYVNNLSKIDRKLRPSSDA